MTTTTTEPVSGKVQTLEDLIASGEAPTWMDPAGYATLTEGYLLPEETPKGMYRRISDAAAKRLGKPEMGDQFFDIMWKNWLCPATPIASNLGTTKGMPISCFGAYLGDSIDSIWSSMREIAMLSKNGGGLGLYWGDVRPRGAAITGNGRSEGIVPFLKVQDSTTVGISQGSTRRGASAAYLPIEHGDLYEFLQSRRPEGDPNRQCLNLQHAVTIGDDFMHALTDSENSYHEEARSRWRAVLKSRWETGGPYLMFRDTTNRDRPECYKANGLEVKTSQLCSEIELFCDNDHTFVCCLSSMNVARFDEWRGTNAVQLAIWFLDAVMSEFIDRARSIPGFEKAIRFSEKSRALGLGVLGWHTYCQEHDFPLDSMEAYLANATIFKKIRSESEKATADLAREYGEPEWCRGHGRRNTHVMAVAPTASNSVISGNVSPGIEPIAANMYSHKTAKGTFFQRNKTLIRVLESYGQNTDDVWNSILAHKGSVRHLDFLTDHEKEVFLTAREVNMFALLRLAAGRQKHIDQTQSLNLFFPMLTSPSYFNQVHYEAWKLGVHTLYYCRSESVLKGDAGLSNGEGKKQEEPYHREASDCKMCEG